MAQGSEDPGLGLTPQRALTALLAVLLGVLAYIWQEHVSNFKDHIDTSRESVQATDRVVDAIIERLEGE